MQATKCRRPNEPYETHIAYSGRAEFGSYHNYLFFSNNRRSIGDEVTVPMVLRATTASGSACRIGIIIPPCQFFRLHTWRFSVNGHVNMVHGKSCFVAQPRSRASHSGGRAASTLGQQPQPDGILMFEKRLPCGRQLIPPDGDLKAMMTNGPPWVVSLDCTDCASRNLDYHVTA